MSKKPESVLSATRDILLVAFSLTLFLTWLSAAYNPSWTTQVRMTGWFGWPEAVADGLLFSLGIAVGAMGMKRLFSELLRREKATP